MPLIHEADTAEFPVPSFLEAAKPQPRPRSVPIRVEVAGISDPGLVRPNNEDHFLISRFGRFLETLQTNLPDGSLPTRVEEGGYCLLVADGIGGHAAGDVASQLAINTIINLALAMPDWILRLDDEHLVAEVMRRTEELFRRIHEVLTERAKTDPSLTGFGTTLTMATSIGKELFITSIGDSRAYLFRSGKLQQLTRDHTLAQGLADRGLIAQHEVAAHRMRNVLTKSLGAATKEVEPDVWQLTLENGDSLLLCSDGLTDMVHDNRIAEILRAGEPAAKTCQRLVDQALQAGGKDNVSVVFARYRIDDSRQSLGAVH